jgi:hypothetical protein
MLFLLTPTGNRLIQFNFCVEMMRNQTYSGDVTWIIVDDGKEHMTTPSIKNWNIIHEKLPEGIGNTQAKNIIHGLQYCDKNSKLIVIEDDDFYHKDWLEIIDKNLEYSELSGITKAKYYHIKTSTYKVHNNLAHSSLCSTGLRGANAFDFLKYICLKYIKFIDIHLWRNFTGKKYLFDGNNVIGIKGMPGREGIGSGHYRLLNHKDTSGNILNQWVGTDWADKYRSIYSDPT